jgi:hypothetical protein
MPSIRKVEAEIAALGEELRGLNVRQGELKKRSQELKDSKVELQEKLVRTPPPHPPQSPSFLSLPPLLLLRSPHPPS